MDYRDGRRAEDRQRPAVLWCEAMVGALGVEHRFEWVWPRAWIAAALSLAVLLGAANAWGDEFDELEDDPFADYEEEIQDENDPLEIPNRLIFSFNQALDAAIIRPAAVVYRDLVPQYLRDRVRNVLRNLRSPVILANDLLQGNLDRAGTTTRRFVINSTAGIFGIWDVAVDMGDPYHAEDFGQTLGSYGIGEGPYLMLPLLGPSNVRDATGRVVDYFLDPLTYIADHYDKDEWLLYRAAAEGIDFRERNLATLDEIERDALDFYARLRSLYRQRREAEIRNDLEADSEANARPTRLRINQASNVK